MDDRLLTLTQVELNLSLDFLVKAIAYAEYDPKLRLAWNVEDWKDGKACPNTIYSSKYGFSNKLKLQFDWLQFSVHGKSHVCYVGEPVLQDSPAVSGDQQMPTRNTTPLWENLENEKQTQTAVTIKTCSSGARKRKVGRPRKIVIQENPNPTDSEPKGRSSSFAIVNNQDPGAASGHKLVENNDVSKDDLCDDSTLKPTTRKRYGLRGAKLNSKVMGAVKGVDEEENNGIEAAETECFMPSDNDNDHDFIMENNKKQNEKLSGNSNGNTLKCSKLNTDWIPKPKRRQKRTGTIECKVCKKLLCDYTGVYDHVKKKHSRRKGVTEYLKELDSLKIETCKICGLVCSDRKKLILHEDREHVNIGEVKCSECEKTFKNLSTLKSHVRLMHLENRRSILCHLCSAAFKSASSLKQHIDQVHLAKKYFECDVCSKKFYNMSQLRRHSKIHNIPESRKYECPHCGRRFIFNHNLKKHIGSVHVTHQEIFHCSYCGKGFGQKGGMLSHIQFVHFNIFPYSCKECKATFARALMLIEHMKSYHKVMDYQVTEKPLKYGIYNKTAEDMFFCSYCREGFLHKTRLVEHMHTDHSDAFPFKCENCNQGFLEKSFLVIHKRKAHGELILEDQQEDSEKENSRKHEILQVISAKEGYPSKIVHFGQQENAAKLVVSL